MATMIDKNCKNCGSDITVRLADHKRGWGNFCNKRCKAKHQERRTGQYKKYLDRERRMLYNNKWDLHPHEPDALGQWID